MTAILSLLSLYGGNRKTKLPLYIIGYMPPKGTLGILVVAPSDGRPAIASRLASTQALRSQRMFSTSKSLGAPRSCLCPVSLWSWLCGSTEEPDSFVVNCRKLHRLGAALTPIPLMTWLPRSSRLGVGFME
jgi:hypothetical protein